MSQADIHYMQRCLGLAEVGRYTANPNPVVGAILVTGDTIIAEGFHERAGQDHAEIMALKKAGDRARGATLYVTLEPCSHTGRTGPCADAVIEAGVARVVYGMVDPNPAVSGNGLDKLRAAGIQVDGPVLPEAAEALNRGFAKRMREGLPYVRCKLAMSLDGRTAMASGESKWITGPEAREDVQKLRAQSGVVMSGIETVLVDDPGLDARFEGVSIIQPLRVIVDSRLRIPPAAKTLQLPGEVMVATAVTSNDLLIDKQKELARDNVVIVPCANTDGRVDLEALLRYLAVEKQCNDILLETGAELAGAMLDARLVDEVITYIAPKLLGSDARPLFNLRGKTTLSDHVALELCDVVMLGKDCRMRSRVKRAP